MVCRSSGPNLSNSTPIPGDRTSACGALRTGTVRTTRPMTCTFPCAEGLDRRPQAPGTLARAPPSEPVQDDREVVVREPRDEIVLADGGAQDPGELAEHRRRRVAAARIGDLAQVVHVGHDERQRPAG